MLITSALLALGLGCAPVQAEEPRKYALLVGIDDYADGYGPDNPVPSGEQWTSLTGTHNDVKAVKDLLIERGFAEGDIKILHDEDATNAGIQQAFREHLGQAAGGDVALFYYSGHGHQVTDDNADEQDGYDEALVPFDNGGSRTGRNYLRDDDLNTLKGAIKTDNLVFILDSCNSGTATRGSAVMRGDPVPAGAAAKERGAESDAGGGFLPVATDDARGYVMLSAARSSEPAVEMSFGEDGERKVMGAFTWLLIQELRRADSHLTWSQVNSRVQSRMKGYGLTQIPQAEGDVGKELFSGAWGGAPTGYAAELKSGRVSFAAGSLHGVGEGDVIGVYATGGDALLAEAAVEAVKLSSATAALMEGQSVSADAAVKGLEARVLQPNLQLYVPRLDLVDAPAAARQALQSFADKNNIPADKVLLDAADRGQAAPGDLVVRKTAVKGGEHLQLLRVTDEAGEVGVPIPIPTSCEEPTAQSVDAGDPALGELLQQAVELDRVRSRIQELDNEGAGRLDVTMKVHRVDAHHDEATDAIVVDRDHGELDARGAGGSLKAGQEIHQIHITNHEADKSVYVAVLELRTDGGLQRLFPFEGLGRDETLLKPGQTLPIEPMRADEAPGQLTWKLIATTEYVDFSALEKKVICGDQLTRGEKGLRGDDELSALFADTLLTTRSSRLGPAPGKPWGTDVYFLEVVE